MDKTPSLRGRIAVVTGGGWGPGEATGRALARAGATIIVADHDGDAAGRVAETIRSCGASAESLAVDVRDQERVDVALRDVAERHGRLDILINNAGTDVAVSIDQLTVADWDNVIAVNLRGPFVASHSVFPLMRAQGGGQIVNIVSTAARRAWANATAYRANRWGLLGLSHALHVEGRACGIKVTAVVSGGVRTAFCLDRVPDVDPAVLQDPHNVAETIRFVLCQPEETVIPEITVIPMKETLWP